MLDPSRAQAGSAARPARPRRARTGTSLFAQGEPMIWMTGGSLLLCVLMIVALLGFVLYAGLATFWPGEVVRVTTADGRVYMGERVADETYRPGPEVVAAVEDVHRDAFERELAEGDGLARRIELRTGNYRITQTHFQWIDAHEITGEEAPEWALVLERLEWGRFYGIPRGFAVVEWVPRDTLPPAATPAEVRDAALERLEQLRPAHGGEPRLLAEAWVDGSEQEVLLPADRVDEATRILGVAEEIEGEQVAWDLFNRFHGDVRARWRERRGLEKHDTGRVNAEQERARLAVRGAELRLADAREAHGPDSAEVAAALRDVEAARAAHEERLPEFEQRFARIRGEIDAINRENRRYRLWMTTAGEGTMPPVERLVPLDEIVRAYPANRMSFADELGLYLSRWWEYLSDWPREANSEGGVRPAIFGTVAMTLIMALAVVPFGVLAALYLREYAKGGAIVSAVRIAVNNLAGVPSIVFGVFGLGFFCYAIGASLDEVLFRERLPNPTYGKGGLMWAALTLALLTLPVVIVATEEALSAVPNSMREGSYACGASKWQTIRRIVLPRAMPGIMTGTILAMARGAGEVAPLMLVGAVKLAPELPVDGTFPFVHPERSFMHLGFHIYDVGFQSQNSEAAKPMVFTTTLLLIAIIALLNVAAIWMRRRLGRRFVASQV